MTPEEHLEKIAVLFREFAEMLRVEPITEEQQRASDRKWFAGIAMQGLVANANIKGDSQSYAHDATKLADALLAALAAPSEEK